MIRLLVPVLLIGALAACIRPRDPGTIPAHAAIPIQAFSSSDFDEHTSAEEKQYDSLLSRIESTRSEYAAQFQHAEGHIGRQEILQEAKSFLLTSLKQDIWPLWIGTPWDFNGISEEPGKGEIACGYFVSTTLKHAGFHLNRYRLAQQGATTICKALSPELQRFQGLDALQSYLEAQEGDRIYVVGLDYHVGFIDQQDSSLRFTHASYYAPAEVVSQKFSESAVLQGSKAYVLAPLFESGTLVEDWLTGKQVYPKP